jgi:TPR repeat protein
LGNFYLNGIGVTQDTAKGTALLQKACNGGVGNACALLKKLEQ